MPTSCVFERPNIGTWLKNQTFIAAVFLIVYTHLLIVKGVGVLIFWLSSVKSPQVTPDIWTLVGITAPIKVPTLLAKPLTLRRDVQLSRCLLI